VALKILKGNMIMKTTLYKTGMTFGIGIILAAASQASMLYQFNFRGEDDASRLTSAGSLKETAELKVIDGQKIEFVNDVPVKDGVSCKFTASPDGNRAAMLVLPGSSNLLPCAKTGDKLTISLWVKWNGIPENREAAGLVSKSNLDQTSGWMFRIMPKGELNFASCGGYGSRNSTSTIPKNQWTHVAVTWDVGNSNGVKMYIDGKDAGINVAYVGEAGSKTNTETIRVGTQTPGFHLPLNGSVCDVRLYDEVLAPEAIQKLAAEGIPSGDKENK
jgi:hypothetical protein